MYEQMLREFHKKYGHFVYSGERPPTNVIDLRMRLIREEVDDETLPVLRHLFDNSYPPTPNGPYMSDEAYEQSVIALADGLADSIYVLVGTAVSFGIPIDRVFREVHSSNMTKSMKKDTKSIPGKTLKGPDFVPPNIEAIVREALKHGSR